MIGVVVVAHDNIGPEMVSAVKKIIKDVDNIIGIAIESDQPTEVNRNLIRKAMDSVDKGNGIILMSDMFGGTPSNLCLSFLEKGSTEVISGVNLPMIIKLASERAKRPLGDLVAFIQKYGQKNIVIASEVLEGKVDYS